MTDTEALTERIARALDPWIWTDEDDDPSAFRRFARRSSRLAERPASLARAAAVLPIVEAEVRAAKAEALREAVEKYAITIPDALGYKVPAVTVEDLMDAADEYETGDSDEHR